MLRRGPVVVGLSLVALMAGAVPAWPDDSWGSVDCTQNPHPGCDLGAGKGPQEGSPGHGGDDASPRRGGRGGGGRDREDPESSNPDFNRSDCSYRRSDYKPPPGAQPVFHHGPRIGGISTAEPAVFHVRSEAAVVGPIAEPKPGEDGAWYVYKCDAGGTRDALYRPPVWIPDGPQPEGGPSVSPAALAEQARSHLRLPSPKIRASPADEQLVTVPTWLWLERGAWRKVSATASVPGVSVTAVARPVSVDWSMGDGGSRVCHGPGTPYRPGKAASRRSSDPKRSSPDCGYTYRSSSLGRRGDAYPVSVTVTWSVTWSGAGQSGTFPGLRTTSAAAFRVAESQAVNTDNE